jgi:hypothetical protein
MAGKSVATLRVFPWFISADVRSWVELATSGIISFGDPSFKARQTLLQMWFSKNCWIPLVELFPSPQRLQSTHQLGYLMSQRTLTSGLTHDFCRLFEDP